MASHRSSPFKRSRLNLKLFLSILFLLCFSEKTHAFFEVPPYPKGLVPDASQKFFLDSNKKKYFQVSDGKSAVLVEEGYYVFRDSSGAIHEAKIPTSIPVSSGSKSGSASRPGEAESKVELENCHTDSNSNLLTPEIQRCMEQFKELLADFLPSVPGDQLTNFVSHKLGPPVAKPGAKKPLDKAKTSQLSALSKEYVPSTQIVLPTTSSPSTSRVVPPAPPRTHWAKRFEMNLLRKKREVAKNFNFEGARKDLLDIVLNNGFQGLDMWKTDAAAVPPEVLRKDRAELRMAEDDIAEYFKMSGKELKEAESREFMIGDQKFVLTSLMPNREGRYTWDKIYGYRHFTPVKYIKEAFTQYQGNFARDVGVRTSGPNEMRLWFVARIKDPSSTPDVVLPKRNIKIIFQYDKIRPGLIQIVSAYFQPEIRPLDKEDLRNATVRIFQRSPTTVPSSLSPRDNSGGQKLPQASTESLNGAINNPIAQ